MKKSFSLLEIIFTITIIATISIVAIPKLFYNIDNANIIKLKSDVALIRDEINKYNNKQVLLNTNELLTTLDNGILSMVVANPKSGQWTKLDTNKYNAWITSTTSVTFTYNSDTGIFDCDFSQEYCSELTQ